MLPWSLVTHRHIWGVTVHVAGEMDRSNVDDLLTLIENVYPHGETLELELSGLNFIDARGLEALLRLKDGVDRGGGVLVLRAPTAQLLRLLDITGLRSTFALVDARQRERVSSTP